MKAQTMCTIRRAKRIIAGLWLTGIVYCSPWLYLTKTETIHFTDDPQTPDIWRCGFRLDRHQYRAYYMADLGVFYIIPLVLTLVLYGFIARMLYAVKAPRGTRGSIVRGSIVMKQRWVQGPPGGREGVEELTSAGFSGGWSGREQGLRDGGSTAIYLRKKPEVTTSTNNRVQVKHTYIQSV